MKILTIAGTRPELIRLSIIIKKLDKLVDHVFVYTNQNYDYNLSGKFFDELHIRKPNYYFEGGYSFVKFLSLSMLKLEEIIIKEKPNKVLILGDTNSGLLSIIAEKYNIPVYHMEAGNRCYDDRVPEETNRKIIDNVSKYNLPYTENSKQNLLTEGFDKNYVFKTGNPIYEVLKYYEEKIENSDILNKLMLYNQEFVLVTVHRSENVDFFEPLNDIVLAINKISNRFKVVFSLHPRTKNKIKEFDIKISDHVILSEPFGFFDFVKLEGDARLTISDSGTVQEECCIISVPSITIRNSTERHETIECGSNILSGTNKDKIIDAFEIIIGRHRSYDWYVPEDYTIENVSDIVINILLGKN